LTSFTSGADAGKLGRLTAEDRLRVALEETTKVWPEAPRYWEGAAIKYRNEDPWVRGCYFFLNVGQRLDYRKVAGNSEGRVHFAGEHTETSSMDGAIKSGVRVAEEIKGTKR
jgi:monoamine oxidase